MAVRFSSGILEQIRAASDIVEVIGAYIPLKRAGAGFVALCPFHKEKSPSFNVNPSRQIFHCFGCHKGGDVFTFVKEYENVDFSEALRRLAERARIPLEVDQSGPDPGSRGLKETLLQIHEQITQRWQNAFANDGAGQIARDYLVKRGVSAEAVKLFRIGYAPELWDDTVNWAKSKGFDLAVVEKAGLILRKEGTDHYYDRFRGRLIFPICDEQGRVIGFSGRVLSGDEKTAKYVNSPETPIFTKSKVFYGLDKSKRAILSAGFAVVCEGQLDLIACFMNGIENIVAPQGTAFTGEHARIIKRYVEEVVLCFDSDEAGQNAAVRSLDHLLASGLAVRVAVVPAPHDPDSFIKSAGSQAFRTLIQKAQGFFDYYLERLCGINDVRTDKGRLSILRGMAEAIHKTGNRVLADTYAQKTALRLGVTPDSVRVEFGKMSRPRTAPVSAVDSDDEDSTPAPTRPNSLECWLLKLLVLHEDLVDWAAVHLDLSWLNHEFTRQILALRFAANHNQTWSGFASFVGECDSQEIRNFLTECAVADRPIPNPLQQLTDIVLKLRNQHIDRELAELLHRASQPETAEAERIELLRQQQVLRGQKREPLAERPAPF